jgi:hypothetical protein
MRGGCGGIGQELSGRGHPLTRERSEFAPWKRAERGLNQEAWDQVRQLMKAPDERS